jgi:prepilin-type processing-associated H-X9-DG protein
MQEYCMDWDGEYPNTGNPSLWMGRYWRWAVQPYLALAGTASKGNPLISTGGSPSVLVCPSDSSAVGTYDGTSYAYSMCFYVAPSQIDALTSFGDTVNSTYPPCTSQTESALRFPAQKAIVTEWASNHESPHVGWNDPTTAWKGARNFLLADGHCKYLQSTQIHAANDSLPDINLTHGGISGTDLD